MEIKEMVKVMQHFENGGEVEIRFKDDNDDTWVDTDCTSWNWSMYDYRIKEQKQKVTIEKWLLKDIRSKEYFTTESSDIESSLECMSPTDKIKLLETYEVEI